MTEQNMAYHKARATLMRRLFASRVTEVVGLAARLELPDAIDEGGTDAVEIARRRALPVDGATRLLRALVSVGMCVEVARGRFALTEMGAMLRGDHPDSQLEFAKFHTAPMTLLPWSKLEHSVRTGRPAFDEQFGMPLYEYLGRNAGSTALFNTAMSQESRETAAAVVEHYDFSPYRRVMDVGGGDGTLISAILQRHPHVHGAIFESAGGAAQAADTLKAAGLDDRCAVVTGDFFVAVPEGSDLYVVKSVIHNWDDEQARVILRNIRAAMSDQARLLIVDVVLPDQAMPDAAGLNHYIRDLQMLVLVGGRERTRADLDQLCAQVGLVVTGVVPLPQYLGFSVIEIVPAPVTT